MKKVFIRNKLDKAKLISRSMLLLFVALFSFFIYTQTADASSAEASNCRSSSEYHGNITSMSQVCQHYDNGGKDSSSYGAIWFGSETEDKTTIEIDGKTTSKSIELWGKIYVGKGRTELTNKNLGVKISEMTCRAGEISLDCSQLFSGKNFVGYSMSRGSTSSPSSWTGGGSETVYLDTNYIRSMLQNNKSATTSTITVRTTRYLTYYDSGQTFGYSTTSDSFIITKFKKEDCEPKDGEQKVWNESEQKYECKPIPTETTTARIELYSHHETLPGLYYPLINIKNLNTPNTSQDASFGIILDPNDTPAFKQVGLPLRDTKRLSTTFDFYPEDGNPVETESTVAAGNEALTSYGDFGFLKDAALFCGGTTSTAQFQAVQDSLEAAFHAAEDIAAFVLSFADALSADTDICGNAPELCTGGHFSEADQNNTQFMLNCLAAIGVNGLDFALQNTFNQAANINNRPIPSIEEGVLDLQVGEEENISAFAYMPTNAYRFTFDTYYWADIEIIKDGDGNISKRWIDGDSDIINFLREDYQCTNADLLCSSVGSISDVNLTATDYRKVRRLGYIYGTSFTTRLKSVEKGSYTGNLGYNAASAEITVEKDETELENEISSNIFSSEFGSIEYNEANETDKRIYAGSNDNDYIKATYEHAAGARTNKEVTSDEVCSNTMSTFDIPWYINGDLRTSSNIDSSSSLNTQPFRLNTDNSQGYGCKNEVGLNPSYTSEEIIKNDNIPLGSDGTLFKQRGYIYTDYSIDKGSAEKRHDTKIEAEVGLRIHRPWNYNLQFDSVKNNSSNGKALSDEGETTITVSLSNNNNNSNPNQKGNPSYSPDNIELTLYEIDVGSLSDLENNVNKVIDDCNNSSTISTGSSCIMDHNVHIANPVGTKTVSRLDYNGGSSGEIKFENVLYESKPEDRLNGIHKCYYVKINYSNSVRDTSRRDGYVGNPSNRGVGGNPDDPHPLFSRTTCFTTVGVPHAEIWGGSVFSEGGIITKIFEQTSSKGNYIIGSWSDFGVIGRSSIKGLASGKTISRKNKNVEYKCNNHPLTINNFECDDSGSGTEEEKVKKIGYNTSTSTKTKTSLLTRYRKTEKSLDTSQGLCDKSKTDCNLRDESSYPDYYCYNDSSFTKAVSCDTKKAFRYTISDGNLGIDNQLVLDKGATHVIYASGDITINRNIYYRYSDPTLLNDAYTKINEIPQYIIIADGSIKIDNKVTEINAWLIADGNGDGNGTIDTCLNHTGPLDSRDEKACENQLVINGPIFANKIELERTHYLEDEPAEKFDISAFSYYWAYFQSKQSGKMTTVYQRTLPPRH